MARASDLRRGRAAIGSGAVADGSTTGLLTRIRGSIFDSGWGSAPDPGIFSGMAPMSQSCHKKPGPGREFPGQGLTRLGRIGGRDIPRPVACQQSLLPFFPAQQFDPQIQPPSSLLGHRCHALKMPGVWGQSPHSFNKSYPRILVRNLLFRLRSVVVPRPLRTRCSMESSTFCSGLLLDGNRWADSRPRPSKPTC